MSAAAGSRWRQVRPRGRPWVIAHRGDSAFAPENTLEAARRAHQLGADAWELDVHLTRDGVPVVFHDESLCRTTDVLRVFEGDPRIEQGSFLADFDLSEIQRLDAGSWFVANPGATRSASAFGTLEMLDSADRDWFSSGEVRIPTLWEALELTRQLDWAVNVELKSVPSVEPALAGLVLEAVRGTETTNRVLVSSFDHAEVAWVAKQSPEIATAALSTTPIFRPARYCRELLGADAYHPAVEAIGALSTAYRRRPGVAALRMGDLEELRRNGIAVSVYTVNDAAPGGLSDHLADAGVFGIFTDDPSALVRRWRR
jgi:glycerophosphoryl diester phosphodiesterase